MNRNIKCELPWTLFLVLAQKWQARWNEQHQRFPYFPPAEDAIAQLNAVSQQGEGVPATLHERPDGSTELRLYTADYYLGLYPNSYGDGYILSHMAPMDPRAHDLLADGVLLLHGTSYALCYALPDIPSGSDNGLVFIRQTWQKLEQEKQRRRSGGEMQELATIEQKKYLNMISDLIDITSDLEREKYAFSTLIPYRNFTSTDGQRSGLHDIYEFYLYQPVQLWQERYLFRITTAPDLRGRILSLSGRRLKIKFEMRIDRRRIPEQGSFEILPNSRIFDVQRQAVSMFSDGTARNRHLLPILVNQRYQPYQPMPSTHPDLNREQNNAFQAALTIPDLLLVLGPPGTGKTHTITEIIRHNSRLNKERILVVSRTHKAVDNVLSRLPASLEVVRLGHEDRVSEENRHLLLNAKAAKMQTEIIRRTERHARELACFLDDAREVTSWRCELAQLIKQLEYYEQKMQDNQERKEAVIQKITMQFNAQSQSLQTQLKACREQLRKLSCQKDRRQLGWKKYEIRAQVFALGWFFAWLARQNENRFLQIESLYEAVQARYIALMQAEKLLQERIQCQLWADTEYRMLEDAVQQIKQSSDEVVQQTKKIVGLLHATVEGFIPGGMRPNKIQSADVRQYASWYEKQYPFLVQRAALMRDWRAHLTDRSEQLRPEIILYADVIGVTCIGVATAGNLEKVPFDLVVVDEAGQICLTDLLIPLARARRAVLVGDHQQLPPFVDNEVRDWLASLIPPDEEDDCETEYAGVDIQAVRRHLARSAFELLFALLYPLWLVEINAYEENKRPYALIEQFIERGIYEAHICTTEEMVNFFGLSTALVTKVLNFLTTIQHIQRVGNRWVLTELGRLSLSQGIKIVNQEKGQHLYFDGFYSQPLLQDHYTKSLQIISDLQAESIARTPTGGARFYRLHSTEMWRTQALDELIRNPERGLYNLPRETINITASGCSLVYMPIYIISAYKQRKRQVYYLAYTHIKNQRDTFFEQLVNLDGRLRLALDAMPGEENLADLWLKWLVSQDLSYLRPEQTSDGRWRVAFPEGLVHSPDYPLQKIGTFHRERGYFLQLWCDNQGLRHLAVMERGLHLLAKRHKTLKHEYFATLLRHWSELLEVTVVQISDLYSWAKEKHVGTEMLQKLAEWSNENNT